MNEDQPGENNLTSKIVKIGKEVITEIHDNISTIFWAVSGFIMVVAYPLSLAVLDSRFFSNVQNQN